MTTKTAPMFSLDNLDIFKRPGAKVEKREDQFHAGCWVHFDNGWTVSIQWGSGNYSDNYNRALDQRPRDSTTAEVAAWKGKKADLVRWGTEEYADTVLPYVSMARVELILDLCAQDKLTVEYQPPTPPPPEPEIRAVDGWKD